MVYSISSKGLTFNKAIVYAQIMLDTIRKEWQAQILILLFVIWTFFWLYLQFLDKQSQYYQLFSDTYGFIALFGGACGIGVSLKWGGVKSVMGKAILFFSLGLLAQEFGQIAYTFYFHVLHVNIPYPSIGDLGYFGSIPLYILGAWYIAKASGAKIGFQSFFNKIQVVIIPVVMLSLSYWFFLKNYNFSGQSALVVFLDFGYPFGQAIYISVGMLAYLLSRKLLGGMMRSRVLFLLFALFLQYVADYMFLYQHNQETWSSGGINDYIYLLAYFVMSLSLIEFLGAFKRLKSNS